MLRYAIAGCGAISRRHFEALGRIAEAEVVALADPYEDLREKAAEAYGAPRTFAGLEEMLDGCEFDVLLLLTPTHLHAEHCLAAAGRGCTVLVEKPLAPTVAECRQIIEAYRASGSRLGVLHSSRFVSHSRWARQYFDDGTLGRPVALDFMAYRPREDASRFDPRFWRLNPGARGHGICINILCHWTDLARYVTRREPKRVHAVVRNLFSRGIVPEDNAQVTVEFEDGVVGTWRYVCGEPGCGSARMITHFGSRGRLVATDVRHGDAELWIGTERRHLKEEDPAAADARTRMHAEFLEAIQSGATLPVAPEDGLAAVRVSEAVYESASSGQVVTL